MKPVFYVNTEQKKFETNFHVHTVYTNICTNNYLCICLRIINNLELMFILLTGPDNPPPVPLETILSQFRLRPSLTINFTKMNLNLV